MSDIGEKNYLISGVAQESTSNEIKDLVQNIKPGGDAKESSVQEVLNAIGNVALQSGIQEILSKIGQGIAAELKAPSSAQAVTALIDTYEEKTLLTITGKGRAHLSFWQKLANIGTFSLFVDGKTFISDGVGPNSLPRCNDMTGLIDLRFNNSIKVTAKNFSSSNTGCLTGIIYFD